MLALRNIWSIYKREMKAFFLSPIAYVIVIAFVFLAMLLCFWLGNILDSGDSSLSYSFFPYALIIMSMLAPAVAMRLWSDEHRDGTIELLLTMPAEPWHAIFGKFLAACSVWILALALCFPIVMTISYLGDPDPGPIWGGFLGAFFHAAACIAITMAVSAFTRSQVTCLIIAWAICLPLTFLGFPPLIPGMKDILGETGTTLLQSISPMKYALEMGKGFIRFSDVLLFVSICTVGLLITSIAIRARRA